MNIFTFIMKIVLSVFAFVVGGALLVMIVNAADLPVLRGQQGGTGVASTTIGNVGKFLQVSSVSPLVWTLGSAATSTGITSLNGLTGATQTFATSSAGSGFNLTSSGTTHTLAIGTATSTTTGLLTGADWSVFNSKLGSAITSLNGLLGTSQTFASSTTGTDFNISSSGTTHTFNLVDSSATNRGLLTAANWTTFNNKLSAAVTSLNGLSGATQTFATSTDGSDIDITSSGTTHTFKIPETSSSTRGAVSTSTYATLAKSRFDFYLENPTATEDIALMTFDATSTILKAYAVNKTNSDTVTFNLFHAASRAQATSTSNAVFAAYQTNTATTTPVTYASFASSTVNNGSVLRLNTSAASSTQFIITIYYREGT